MVVGRAKSVAVGGAKAEAVSRAMSEMVSSFHILPCRSVPLPSLFCPAEPIQWRYVFPTSSCVLAGGGTSVDLHHHLSHSHCCSSHQPETVQSKNAEWHAVCLVNNGITQCKLVYTNYFDSFIPIISLTCHCLK